MITSITHVTGTNRIHKVGTQTMAFDAAGNLTSYAGKTFTHGADGRLRTSTTSAGTVTYQYDGLGRRVSKSDPVTLVPGGFVRYMYDQAHHLIGEYQADGTPIKEYVWIGDLPVAMIRFLGPWSLEGFAIETDHLGTPRLLTDATRAPRWRWTSPPFGEVLPDEDPSALGTLTFNLRFPGQYYDKETGLHYNWNRYYDPERGRYIQSDPIGLEGGWNTYGYVGGNPVLRTDPSGLAYCRYSIDPPGLVCISKTAEPNDAGIGIQGNQISGPQSVFSGDKQCRNDNSQTCIETPKEGPIPPGCYDVVPHESRAGFWRLIPKGWNKLDSALYRLQNDYGVGNKRGGFMLHPGSISWGCITISANALLAYRAIDSLLRAEDGSNSLCVSP